MLYVWEPRRPGEQHVRFVPTPLPSPSPQRARHSHATAHLLFKHSRVLACSCSKRPSRVVAAGHVHVCVMDDNRPTPLRSRARTGRKGIWKTQRSRSSFYVCRVEELILRSTVFYNVVPLVTDLSGSLGPVHCIVQPPPPPKMCSIRTTEPTRTDESQRADRATGRSHSSQAGVKGSMPTYSNSLPRRHAQGKLVASCHTMGLSGLAPSTGHALQPMATFLVRTASR